MRINCKIGEPEEVNDFVVLVDVFRSSTSIVTLLDGGCEHIKPFTNPEKAKKLKGDHEREGDIVLVGERHGKTIEGFDFNISPTNLARQDFENKIVFYRSSNLTRVLDSCKGADEVIIGGMVNAESVSDYLENVQPEFLDLIICGISRISKEDRKSTVGLGKKAFLNRITIEDLIGAGAILHFSEPSDLSDLGLIARLAYENKNWKSEIKNGFISSYLSELGYSEDLEYCIRENQTGTVPIYKDGRITVF